MKKLLFPLAVMAIITMAFVADGSLAIGDALPMKSYTMKTVDNQQVSLAGLMTEKGLLVMFSCNTCPYVIKNQDRTNQIMAYAKSQGLGVVVVNSNEAYRTSEDSFDAMKDYAKEQGYTWPYAVDNNHQLADAFGATRTPECYLFNTAGTLVYHGAIDDSPSDASSVKREHLKFAINEMNAGKDISVNTSRSVGCAIKRVKKS